MSKEILAVIPARGGSKGILRKNLQFLAGKPLLAHSIESAKGSVFITRIIISTDDLEIAAVAEANGADVVWRPDEISGDLASSESALLHVLETLLSTENYQPDILVFLQCTSPLTLSQDIDGTINELIQENADSALAVTPFHYFLWKPDVNGGVDGVNHDKSIRLLRQERDPQYLETGAVYVMRTHGFLQTKHRFFGRTVMYITPSERRLEIDEPIDLRVAEIMLREQDKEKRLNTLPARVSALVLDFDGVFTDNRAAVFQDGREAVLIHRGDGHGLRQLKERGIPILVLSSETNPVVQARCEKLGLPLKQGVQEKMPVLIAWIRERDIQPAEVVYVGNDINDLDCLLAVGCGAVVADAHPVVHRVAQLVLKADGGRGAIREITDLILEKLET